MSGADVLVRVEHVSKKFCRNLRRSLWYGVQDLTSELAGRQRKHETLRRDEFWAVNDVSFELRRGECLGLIGHNGAGKTTLLRMLNGLIVPDIGRIEMRGRVGAIIALGAGFNPVLTGRENIYVNAAILGFTRAETKKKLDEIVAFSELEEFIDAPIQQYSSGMYVRLGFAVAAHFEPDILLVDEALAVGDISFVFKCLNRIAELRRRGTGVIFVTHNDVQLREAAQRAILLERGRLLANAPVSKALLARETISSNHRRHVDDNYVHPGDITIERVEFAPNPPRTGGPLQIELTLEVRNAIQGTLFELRFWSSSGQLLTTLSAENCDLHPHPASEKIAISIPNLPLPGGTYRIAAGFRRDGGILGWSRDLAHITVLEPEDPWPGFGIIPMQCEIKIG